MAIRLNGWQRLWILFSIVYLPVVVVVTLTVWPSEAEIRLRWDLERQSAEGEQSQVVAFGGWMTRVEAERIVADARAQGETNVREQLQLSRARRVLGRSIIVPATSARSKPGETRSVWVSLSSDEKMMAEALRIEREIAATEDVIDGRFEAELNGLGAQRLKTVGWASLGWLGPVTLLYAFGWSVAWVRRGFGVRPQ